MARSVLALALVGLGAVHALPASRVLQERQSLGEGWGTITPMPSVSPSPPCQLESPPTSEMPPCILGPPITGGMNPPKDKRQGGFGLGSGSPASEREKTIAALELELLGLKSKPNPTEEDLAQIEALEEMLLYTEGITSISAPPGVNTTLTHGNRKRFTLPPDAFSDTKKAIDDLERRLEELQNQGQDSQEDLDEMKDILDALRYLGGITSISAPPGTISTFHPGKRQTIGGPACELVEMLGFQEVLAALLRRYGGPSRAPPDIAQQELYLIEILRQCAPYFGGGSGSGSGGITPEPTYPGGPIIPDPTYPGGGITPVPVNPGGPIQPVPSYPGGEIVPVPVYPGSPMEPVPSQPGGEITPVPVYPGSPMEPVPTSPGGGEIVPVPVYPGSPMEPAGR